MERKYTKEQLKNFTLKELQCFSDYNMDKFIKAEIKYLVESNIATDYKDNINEIILLLKELARRLLLWKKAINDNGINLSGIFFDVVEIILEQEFELTSMFKEEISRKSDRYVSFFDEYTMSAHFNWKKHKDELLQLGYDLPNPYKPYVELFKLGGYGLKFESPTLEVYPCLRIVIHPHSNYMQELPFWDEDLKIND